jgi:hypothetical protein
MGFGDLFRKYGMFPGTDRRVTTSSASQSRSESAIAVNPTNESNIIAISKKFIDPAKYHFTVEPMVTTDGGYMWSASPLPAPAGWDGMTDPVVAFDHAGTAFAVAEPLHFGATDIEVTGIQVFRSTNGGSTWSAPQSLIVGRAVDGNDDKSWMACDRGSASSFKGRVYVAWGVGGALRIARTKDGGNSWIGVGTLQAGANVPGITGAYAPEVSVDDSGIVHIVWHSRGSSTINYTRSIDGGETFAAARTIVNGMVGLTAPPLPITGSWPEFPHAKFRVLTLATGCAIGSRFIVAWADLRDGHSRIYYHYSNDSGATWAASSGQPLWPSLSTSADVQQFHPQLAADGSGVVGCAFYEFGQSPSGWRIKTRIMGSFDQGTTFGLPSDVTDMPWDPAVNAPLSHGNKDDTFIGEYFGLDSFKDGFAVLWTDTRTGVQELFYDNVGTSVIDAPFWFTHGIVATLVGPGVAAGAGGWVIVGGKLVRVPPRGPKYALLQAIAALDAAEDIDHPAGSRLVGHTIEAIGSIVKDLGSATKTQTLQSIDAGQVQQVRITVDEEVERA